MQAESQGSLELKLKCRFVFAVVSYVVGRSCVVDARKGAVKMVGKVVIWTYKLTALVTAKSRKIRYTHRPPNCYVRYGYINSSVFHPKYAKAGLTEFRRPFRIPKRGGLAMPDLEKKTSHKRRDL